MDLDASHAFGDGSDERGEGGVEKEEDWDHGGGGGSGSSKSHHHRHSSSCTTYHASNISYQQSLSYRFGMKSTVYSGGSSGRGSRNGCLQVTSIGGLLGSIAFLIGMLVRILTVPSWQSHGGRITMMYPGETRQLFPIVTQWDDASMRLELAPVDDTTTATGLAMKIFYVPPTPLPQQEEANDAYNVNNDDKAHPSQCHFSLTGPPIRRQETFRRELKAQSYHLDSFYLNNQSTLHVEITTLLVGSSSTSSSSSSSWTTIYLFQGKAALDWLNGKRPEQFEGAARSAQDGGDEERFWNSALWVQSLQNSTTATTNTTTTTAGGKNNATTTTTTTTTTSMAEGVASNGEPPIALLSWNYTTTESDYHTLVYNNDAFWEISPLQVGIDILETTHDLSGLEPYCILHPTTTTTMTRPTSKNGMPNTGGTRHNTNKNRCFWNFYQESDNQDDVERAKRELEGSCIVLQAVSSSSSFHLEDGRETTSWNASNQTLLLGQQGVVVGASNISRANDPPIITIEWKSTREWRRFWIASLLPLTVFSLLCHCNSTSANDDDDDDDYDNNNNNGIVHDNDIAKKSSKKKKKSTIEDSPFASLHSTNPNFYNNGDDNNDKDYLPSYMVVGTSPVAERQTQLLPKQQEGMSETIPLLAARGIS
jgi:hypothetical protein